MPRSDAGDGMPPSGEEGVGASGVMGVDPARCPLCGAGNKCGVVAGAGTCWCFALPVARDMLEQVPVSARGLACVCQACATGETNVAARLARRDELLRGR